MYYIYKFARILFGWKRNMNVFCDLQSCMLLYCLWCNIPVKSFVIGKIWKRSRGEWIHMQACNPTWAFNIVEITLKGKGSCCMSTFGSWPYHLLLCLLNILSIAGGKKRLGGLLWVQRLSSCFSSLYSGNPPNAQIILKPHRGPTAPFITARLEATTHLLEMVGPSTPILNAEIIKSKQLLWLNCCVGGHKTCKQP